MNTDEVYMVHSAMGNDMLCVDNFLYHYEDRRSNIFRWVCNKRKEKVLPCRSRITTKLRDGEASGHVVLKVVGEHTHGQCTPREISRAYERKRRAKRDEEPAGLENKRLKHKLKHGKAYENITNSGSVKKLRKSEDCSDDGNDNEEDESDMDGSDEENEFLTDNECARHAANERFEVDEGFGVNVFDPEQLIEEMDMTKEMPVIAFEDEKLYYMKTSLGRELLCLNRFIFQQKGKSTISETYRWECIRRRDLGCCGRMYTEKRLDGRQRVKQMRLEDHTHGPYKASELAKLLAKNNIGVVMEHEQTENGGIQTFTSADMSANATKIRPSRSLGINCNIPLAKDPLAILKCELDNTNFTFLPSAKGKKVICLAGYVYHYDARSPRNGHAYWTCTLRRDKLYNCNARVTTEMKATGLAIVKVSGRHSHPHCINDIKRRLELYKQRMNAESLCRPGEIIKSSLDTTDESFKRSVGQLGQTNKLGVESETISTSSSCANKVDPEHANFELKHLPRQLRPLRQNTLNATQSVEIIWDVNGADNGLEEGVYFEDHARKCSENSDDTEDESEDLDFDNDDDTDYKNDDEDDDDDDDDVDDDDDEEDNEDGDDREEDNEDGDDREEDNEDGDDREEDNEDDDKSQKRVDNDDEMDDDAELAAFRSVRRGRPVTNASAIGAKPDMNIENVSKLRSAKGGELLCVDGFLYHLKSINNRRTYWTCIKCKDRVFKCKSRVATFIARSGQLKVFKVTNHHTHSVSEDDIKRRLYNTLAKSSGTVKSPFKKREMLDRPLNELSAQYAELVENSLKRQQRKHERAVSDEDIDVGGVERIYTPPMKLYAVSDGPPSLAVRMTLQALGVPFELVSVDYIASEHLSEDYAKMNPQKEIPVLDDNGFYLPESVAIMQYLCDKYAQGGTQKLYPKDAKERAVVNHRLCFNMGFYYASISAHTMAPIFFDYKRTDMSLKKTKNALAVFETYLQRAGTKYAAGEHMTIADLALISATLCLEAIGFDLSAYPLVKRWYATFKREQPSLWAIANGGMQEIVEFEKNPPDLSHMNHPFHPTRKP